jgi:YbgC/YbaW family acyl-CoA thioester hydrolase
MERVKINLPERFSFSTFITIRITDLNYGAHVGNDAFLSLMQEARQQFLMSYGYKELSVEGVGLILSDAAIEYKRELNYADIIKISVAASGFDKYGFDLYYKMEVVTNDETILAAKAKTGMLCYDYGKRKLVTMPEVAKEKLSGNVEM